MWSFECRIRFSPGDLPGTVQRWHRCSVASRPKPKTVAPRRILSPRGTRAQYSKDNENEFHGALYPGSSIRAATDDIAP
jgi:hypothetical protein